MKDLLNNSRVIMSAIISLSLLFSGTVLQVPASELVNVALNKPVEATPSERAQDIIDGIFDQHYGSRWIVADGGQSLRDSARVEIDFEGTAKIHSIKIYSGFTTLWAPPDVPGAAEEGSPADQQTVTNFQFRYLYDGKWQNISNFASNISGFHGSIHEIILNSPVEANRLEFKSVGQTHNYRILEIEVMGEMINDDPGKGPITTRILSLGKPATTNASPGDTSSTPTALTDGVTNQASGGYKWFVNSGALGAYAEIDLLDSFIIYSLKMYNGWPTVQTEFQDNLTSFRFEYYNDNQWIQIPGASENNFDQSLWDFSLDEPVIASKIRVVSEQGARFRLREIEIWGLDTQAIIDGGFETRTGLSGLAISNPLYTIGDSELTTLVGNGGAKVNVKLNVIGEVGTDIAVFTGVYDENNAMRAIMGTSIALGGNGGSHEQISYDLVLPESITASHFLQTYVWKDLNSQWPYSKSFTFPHKDVVESVWSISVPWAPTSISAYSGLSCLELKAEGGGARTEQIIKSQSQGQYELSFYVKGDGQFDIVITDETGSEVISQETVGGSYVDWTLVTVPFTLSEDSVIKISLIDNRIGGVIFVDDIALEIG